MIRREIEYKYAIAEVAAGYVQDGDVIAIDGVKVVYASKLTDEAAA